MQDFFLPSETQKKEVGIRCHCHYYWLRAHKNNEEDYTLNIIIENKAGEGDIEEGVKPILNMQHFMKTGRFSESLIKEINGLN